MVTKENQDSCRRLSKSWKHGILVKKGILDKSEGRRGKISKFDRELIEKFKGIVFYEAHGKC